MRVASLAAVSFAGLFNFACRTPPRSDTTLFNQVEVLVARRNPQAGLEPSDDDQSLFGATLLHYSGDAPLAFELGLRGGRFDKVDGSATNYVETHAGVRWHPFGAREPVRPYLGLGLLWNGRGSTRTRIEAHGEYESNRDSGLAALATWILAQSSPYATLGVDIAFGELVFGAGVRAVCGDGVDLSARHPDDFAFDVFATAGWSF